MNPLVESPGCTNHEWARPTPEKIEPEEIEPVMLEQIETALNTADCAPKHDVWFDFLRDVGRWLDDPSLCDDGESRPPTPVALKRAKQLGFRMYQRGCVPPTFMLPTGDGGVVFEKQSGNATEKVVFDSDGSAEYIGIRDGGIFLRQIWAHPSRKE